MSTNNEITSIGRFRVHLRIARNEYQSPVHRFIATHDRETLLRTIPTGEDVALEYIEAAKDLGCEKSVRKHFAQVKNGVLEQ
jgi:hypothetical protein